MKRQIREVVARKRCLKQHLNHHAGEEGRTRRLLLLLLRLRHLKNNF
jgi:hypothetical protein